VKLKLVEDVALYFAAGLMGAFLVMSWVLLSKYRSLSAELSESADLGRDLWAALDSRMRKQDERILDIMTKFEVYASRSSGSASLISDEKALGGVRPVQLGAKKLEPGAEQASPRIVLEQTERLALQLLSEKARTSVEIKSLINKSREHTARLMKELFERRLVSRDDSKKPFVYQLTEEGRRYLSTS